MPFKFSISGAILDIFSSERPDSAYYPERSLSNGSYSSGNYVNGSLTSNSPGPSPSYTIGQSSSGKTSYFTVLISYPTGYYGPNLSFFIVFIR